MVHWRLLRLGFVPLLLALWRWPPSTGRPAAREERVVAGESGRGDRRGAGCVTGAPWAAAAGVPAEVRSRPGLTSTTGGSVYLL